MSSARSTEKKTATYVGDAADGSPVYYDPFGSCTDPFLRDLRARGAAGQVVNLVRLARASSGPLDPYVVQPLAERGKG